MKYIDADQIRIEIKRRLSNIVTGLDFTAEIELKGLLSFLDTLPEQPVSDHHEIEEAIRAVRLAMERQRKYVYGDGQLTLF